MTRNETFIAHGPWWSPQLDKTLRVYIFEVLNSYLAGTRAGRLKRIEDNFPEDPSIAKQLCRTERTTKAFHGRDFWTIELSPEEKDMLLKFPPEQIQEFSPELREYLGIEAK